MRAVVKCRETLPRTALADRAMGTIISVEAVLEIHIDKTAVASMNPNTSAPGDVPTRLMTFRAMRLCRSHRSMPMATMNPPSNRITM